MIGAFTMATIKRKKATEHLESMKAIAAEHNSNQKNPMIYKILVVFGSYANSDKEILGDLDIGLKIALRNPGVMSPPEANLRQGELLNVDPRYKNTIETLFLGEHAMRTLLKNRRKLINLHDFDEVIREEYPHHVFFEYGPG